MHLGRMVPHKAVFSSVTYRQMGRKPGSYALIRSPILQSERKDIPSMQVSITDGSTAPNWRGLEATFASTTLLVQYSVPARFGTPATDVEPKHPGVYSAG